MIEAQNLVKRYGSTVAVNDLSFSIRPGMVTGFLGPNGAGKTTTMRMILGLDAEVAWEFSSLGGSQGGEAKSISCWASGKCVAGGGYFWGPLGGGTTGFLASELDGRWEKAFVVPGLDGLAVDQYSEVTWVSCPRADDRSAGGYYADDTNAICNSCHTNVFVVNDVHGEWYRAIAVPGLQKLNQGDDATLDAGTCAAPGDCQVLGSYLDANSDFQLYADSEIDGVWRVAQQVSNFPSFDPRGDPSVSSVRCSINSQCVATGVFSNSGTFTANLHNGVWRITKGAASPSS